MVKLLINRHNNKYSWVINSSTFFGLLLTSSTLDTQQQVTTTCWKTLSSLINCLWDSLAGFCSLKTSSAHQKLLVGCFLETVKRSLRFVAPRLFILLTGNTQKSSFQRREFTRKRFIHCYTRIAPILTRIYFKRRQQVVPVLVTQATKKIPNDQVVWLV